MGLFFLSFFRLWVFGEQIQRMGIRRGLVTTILFLCMATAMGKTGKKASYKNLGQGSNGGIISQFMGVPSSLH